jgi:hypothetical protein
MTFSPFLMLIPQAPRLSQQIVGRHLKLPGRSCHYTCLPCSDTVRSLHRSALQLKYCESTPVPLNLEACYRIDPLFREGFSSTGIQVTHMFGNGPSARPGRTARHPSGRMMNGYLPAFSFAGRRRPSGTSPSQTPGFLVFGSLCRVPLDDPRLGSQGLPFMSAEARL